MINIYKKVRVSPFLILLLFLSFISGLFKDVLVFFIIILIHEVGHIITSVLYKWKIKKIEFSVIGGFITYEDIIDRSFKEEFLIAISGILSQSLFFLLMYLLYRLNIIDVDIMVLIEKYHYSILLFNLIPIVPLDGSKILSVFLNNIFSYKKSLKIINLISVFIIVVAIFLIILFNIKMEYSYYIIFTFIMFKIIKMIKEVPYIFNKFLLERYLKKYKFKKIIYINNNDLTKMKRQKNHYFLYNKHYVSENKLLSKRFD